MMPGLESLLRIDLTLIEQASMTCARAFADDPLTAYLIADEKKRVNLHYTFEVPLRISAMGGAEAYATSPECEGIAIWMPSGTKQSPIHDVAGRRPPFATTLRLALFHQRRHHAAPVRKAPT